MFLSVSVWDNFHPVLSDRKSVSEHLSALCSAAGENLASVTVRHSLTEAVLHLALTLFGLVSSFHRLPLHFILSLLRQKHRENMPRPEKKAQCPYFYSSPLYNRGTVYVNSFFPAAMTSGRSFPFFLNKMQKNLRIKDILRSYGIV